MTSRASLDSVMLSHKKNPEVDARRDRRNALKEYYRKREKEAEKRQDSNENEGVKIENIDDINTLLKGLLKDLLALENELHLKIGSNRALIKNIIYNNYSELVRINDYLSDVVVREDDDDDDLIIDESLDSDKLEVLERLGKEAEGTGRKKHVLDVAEGLDEMLEELKESVLELRGS